MKRNYVLPLLAVCGLAAAIFVIVGNNKPAVRRPPVIEPSVSPYASSIAGAGIVEAASGNIKIGTPVSGVVSDIYVKVGDHVRAGDALFRIDTRDLQAELLTANARADLEKVSVQKPLHRLEYLRDLRKKDPGAVSTHELTDLQDDLAQARASYALAKAQVKKLEADIAIRTVRAPEDGKILQFHTRLGEYVEAGVGAVPILLFGRDDGLNVRVDIDETDIWRYEPGADAVAFERGNPAHRIPLEYKYTEQYVIPKTSLTGLSTERADVRVLQVVYGLKEKDQTVYSGQQLDVFIAARTDSSQPGAGAEP